MPDIERPSNLKPRAHQPPVISRPTHDPVSEEEDEETDDGRTLGELQRKKGTSTSQESPSFTGSELFPSPPRKSWATARKWKSSAIASSSDGDQPR
jgi:hypothetical protein